jgi:hypothetical protein
MSRAIATALLGLAFAASAAAADAPAPNATVNDVDGKVSVNQGDGFNPAADGMRLKPGDRVMVQDDSSADLKFDDECEFEVKENKIVTVPDRSPCAGGVPLVQELNPAGGSAIGTTGATGTGNGGVWIMAGIVAAIDLWWLNENGDDTVSP